MFILVITTNDQYGSLLRIRVYDTFEAACYRADVFFKTKMAEDESYFRTLDPTAETLSIEDAQYMVEVAPHHHFVRRKPNMADKALQTEEENAQL